MFYIFNYLFIIVALVPKYTIGIHFLTNQLKALLEKKVIYTYRKLSWSIFFVSFYYFINFDV